MNSKKWKVRPQILNFNNDEPVIFPFSIKTSKFIGICNNTNDPCAKLCVSDVVNVKVYNLM